MFGRGSLTLHPAGQPRRAGLCAPVRERDHPVRRQPVALGAGRRDRPAALEGPRAAGDARAQRVSRASATRPTSSRSRPTASSGSCCATEPERRSKRQPCRREFATLVWTDGWNSLLQRPRARRRSSATCCRHSCPSGAGSPTRRAARSAPKLDAVIPLERDGASAALAIVDVPADRAGEQPLSAAADGANGRGSTASSAVAANARRRGPPRPARGHAARRRDRPRFHRAAAEGHACRRHDQRTASGGSNSARPRPSARCRRRRSTRSRRRSASSPTPPSIVDANYVRQAVPPDQRRHPSGNRDRPLPAGADRLPQRARPARARSSWSRATSAARSPSCIASSRTRATPGPSPAPISTASSTTSACCRPTPPADSDELAAYLQRMRQIGRRTARNAARAGEPARHSDFAPEPIAPTDIARLDRAAARARRAARFDLLGRKRAGLGRSRPRSSSTACCQRATRSPTTSGSLLPPTISALKIRHHGDFHLGQMLIVKDDVFILDFEGEPRPLARRAAAQGAGGARRRRPDPLDRLFDHRGADPTPSI